MTEAIVIWLVRVYPCLPWRKIWPGTPDGSERHHLEIILGHPAIRTGPGVRDVFPARAGGDAFLGKSCGLVVDEAADDAHPGAIGSLRDGSIHRIMTACGGASHCPIPCRRPEA